MDQAHAWTDRRLRDIERRVTEEYATALKEMQIKAREYFTAFRKEDEKRKKLVEKGEMTEREYGKWRAAEMAQGKRYRALIKSMSESLTNSAQISVALVNGRLPEIYGYNHDFGTYEIESGTTVDTSYALYDRDAVYAAMSDRQLYPEAKVNRSKDVAWNRRHVNSAITQGLLQGETIPQIAERLANVASMSATTAMRAARTTVTSAENSGRLDSYRRAARLGISVKKTWLATLDTRTRSSHRRLDGESVPVDEEFSNGLMYPADPDGPGTEIYNCRCTMIADLSEYPREQVSRFSRLNGMSYDEWRGEHALRNVQADAKSYNVVAGSNREKIQYLIDNMAGWTKTATRAQKKSLESYAYSSNDVNNYLLGRTDRMYHGTADSVMRDIENIDAVLDGEEIGNDLKLFRGADGSALGISGDVTEEKLAAIVGTEIEQPSFMSTTIDESVARIYSRGVVMEIDAPSDTHGIYLDVANTSESDLLKWAEEDPGNMEVLLARGYRIKPYGYRESEVDGRRIWVVSCKLSR